MGTQQFCLRWNNHQTNLLAVFDQLLQNEAFVDVTLACEGLSIKAHKMVLSACSPYFQSLFLDNPCQHPIVILKDVRFSELKAVVDFMYKGEVNVSQDQLSALLKTAETLKVKGLAEVTGSSPSSSGADVTRSALGVGPPPNQSGPPTGSSDGRLSPPPKRKRGRPSKRPSTDGDLEVVESLVDVVPDGPDSVPTSQERSMEANPSMKSDILSEAPQSLPEQSLNPPEMTFDGLSQEHTSNSRDSGMMIADQAQTSSSSIGQLPATASTSGMSPGQGFPPGLWVRAPYRTGPCKSWHEETMVQAIRSIFTCGIPIIEASRSSNIPYPTLFFYTNKVKQILKPLERNIPPGSRNWSTQQYKMWTKEAMFTALKAVFARRMTYQQACDHFSIPVPTFYYYMSRVRKVLKPLEKEDLDAVEGFTADQLSIKGRHGRRLNIAENDLNAAILSVVCRSGKLVVPSDADSATGASRSTNFCPTSPLGEEPFHLSSSAGDVEFMNRMNVKPRGRQRSWKQEDMYNAIKAILTHQMSLAKASRQFGIPYPTLKVYLKKVSGMSKPPEWADTETLPPGWTPPQNTWSYQGSSLTAAETDDPQKIEALSRKLNISEVYSESTSDSSQDDMDEDEDPVEPSVNSEPNPPLIENNTAPSNSENRNQLHGVKPPGVSEQSADQGEEMSENESMDDDENDGRENEDEEEDDGHDATTSINVGNQIVDKREEGQDQNSHENNEDEEEHDNRPPWIEVLTLD